MAWSWHFTPMRLYGDKRFLRLSKADEPAANLLLRLYGACDRHGRGPHDDLALGVRTGLVAADDILERMGRLYATGMVLLSADGTSWELERYDDDAPRDVKRDRPASEHPPGQQNGPREKSGEHPGSIRGASGDVPDSTREGSGDVPDPDRISPAHARAHAPPRALPPGRETRQGKEGRQEGGATSAPPIQPSPPGSTDARAIGSPGDGSPPPALSGAGSDRGETWGDDYSQPDPNPPPPPPPTRPPPMTREEELERRRYLREQLAVIERLDAAAKGEAAPA